MSLGTVLVLAWTACSTKESTPLPNLPVLPLENMSLVVRQQVQEAYIKARQDSTSAYSNGYLGMVLHAYGQLEAAEICYERAHLLRPREFRWAYYLGTVRFLLGRDAEGILSLDEALRLRSDYVPALLKLAQSLAARGEWEEAGKIYRSVTEKHPRLAFAHYGLGRVEQARAGPAAAIDHYRRACELSEDFGSAHYALGLAYRDVGEEEQAQAQFVLSQKFRSSKQPLEDELLVAVTRLKASHVQDYFERGLRLAEGGHLEQALTRFEQVLSAKPDMVEAYVALISLYGRLGQADKAEERYHSAVSIDPNHADVHFNFGVLKAERRKYHDAAKAFEKALEIDPTHAEAQNSLGQILEDQGHLPKATQHYRRAIRHKPNYRLAHFNLGRLLFTQGKTDEALQHFLRTLTPEDEQTPQYMLDVAVAFARAGDHTKAKHYAQQAQRRATALEQREVVASSQEVLQELERAAH